ncbi:MAG TPA: MFS transporter, partial [Enterobacteriaceae bacterium]|nr:MFS transporter [Enterobacteriaceae bacterium]
IGGAQVLQLVYPNEIFPTEIRAGAVGVGTSLSRIGAAVGTWLVPVSLQTLGIGSTMYIAAAITFVGLIVSWFLAPETNARSLEDAAALDDEQPRKARTPGPMPKQSVLQKM